VIWLDTAGRVVRKKILQREQFLIGEDPFVRFKWGVSRKKCLDLPERFC